MDKKIFLILIVILSVFVRVLYYYAQPDLSTDHLSQMAMAQNFLDGNGFSFKFIDVHSQIFFRTHIQWPPLYPLLLSVIYLITVNMLIASLIIQIAVLLFLIIIWKKIFNLFNNLVSEEAYFYFISLVIISTSVLNNINTVLIFALLLLSLSLFFTFVYLFDNKSKKINLFFSASFAALLFWTHYSYFFVAFFPAITLVTIYYLRKEKSYLIAGINSFLISLTVTSGVLLYNYINTGSINYMDNPHIWDAGFFPEHLLLTDPFFLNAFFKSSYLIDYQAGNYQYILLPILFQLVSLIIFISIAALLLRLRNNKSIEFDKSSQLFIPFFVIIVLITSFLLYFTLRYHEIPRPGWTHIGDPRYMSAVYLSIIAIVIMLLFVKSDYVNSKFIKTGKSIMIFLIFINLGINIFITAKEWGNCTYQDYNFKNFQGELQALFDNIKLESSGGKQPVFIDNELTVRSFRISQYAGSSVISANEVKSIKEFPSNLVFFFIIPDEEFFRNEDKQLLNWSKKFKLKQIGFVYNNLKLYKVEN